MILLLKNSWHGIRYHSSATLFKLALGATNMKFNTNSIIRPVTAGVVATFLFAGLSNVAFADNKAAFKDAIKVAEAKTTDMKEIDSSAKTPADGDFKKLDANKDGKISLKEAVKDKALTTQFDAADVNHDGMVSTDEYTIYKAGLATNATEGAPAASVN
ncbi:MAG: EF-hand domain-containing protein [Methylotenera sp.]|nr:EF-hand domain-containing protein [Methylotenera sp.]